MPENSGQSLCDFVDPFIGTGISQLPKAKGIASRWWCAKPPVGNTHPGACTPFGMVSVCPYSGAYPTGYGKYGLSLEGPPPEIFDGLSASGFTHFQQSGTGRIRIYYNYLKVCPLPHGLTDFGKRFPIENEAASPGHYACKLGESGIHAELTVSRKIAFHRYRFPNDSSSPTLAVDLTSGGLLLPEMRSFPTAAEIRLIDGSTAEGSVVMEGVTIYFAARCLGAATKSALWPKNASEPGENALSVSFGAHESEPEPFGFLFQTTEPGPAQLDLQLSFSLRSCGLARRRLNKYRRHEFPAIRAKTAARWEEVLEQIEIEGGSEEERRIFYTSFYHSLIKPADFRNENPFGSKRGPFFFDLATLWDLYRTQLPLVLTFFPKRGARLARFLLDTAEREGNFPICYLMDSAPERFERQGSCLAHVTLADAFIRGLPGIDWDRALSIMWKTLRLGRGREFGSKGFVHPLSHTLDLAYANFCTALIAKGIGDQKIYDKCFEYAAFWKNAFNPQTGLLADSSYYEGSNWNYSFRLIHDMAGRIRHTGGTERFLHLLDWFFGFEEPPPGVEVFRFEGLNNEPDMETPYSYTYAGRPDRTAEVVRSVMKYAYATGPGGLPGNDDSGGLSSWYVWNALGIFPVAGQDLFLIGSPIFERTVLHLPEGDLTIEADGSRPDTWYVGEAEWNGRALDQAWIKASELLEGGHLKLRMSDKPTSWAQDRLPPSHSHG